MILKSFEIEKIKIKDKKFFLFYGENQGHKNQIIKDKFEMNLKIAHIYMKRLKF